jgi:hypothetical protein
MMAIDFGGLNSTPSSASVFGSIAMNGDENVRCTKCGYGGCDVRVAGCSCTLHAVSWVKDFFAHFVIHFHVRVVPNSVYTHVSRFMSLQKSSLPWMVDRDVT